MNESQNDHDTQKSLLLDHANMEELSQKLAEISLNQANFSKTDDTALNHAVLDQSLSIVEPEKVNNLIKLINPGALGAGQGGHFRLSSFVPLQG